MSIKKKNTGVNSFEMYFEWFLNELKEAGYVKEYYREPFGITLYEASKLERYNFSTKTPKIEEYSITRDDVYTMDYFVVWDKSAENIFYKLMDGTPMVMTLDFECPFYAFVNQEEKIVSLCDVKPASGAIIYGNNTSGVTFPIKQKVLYNNLGIYINKVIPIPYSSKGEIKSGGSVALFSSVFCPRRFRFSDAGKQPRLIKYKIRSLQDFVQIQTKELHRRLAIINGQQKLL